MKRSLFLSAMALVLVAAAPPSGPVKVGRPLPMAQFVGATISLSGPCNEVATKPLSELPECRALLGKGKTEAVLLAAPRMMMAGNPNFDPAAGIQLLRRAIAAEDNPAVHYLLGSVLASGELVAPRFAEARVHLTRAAAGGNPAAADLLGTLWLRGQGGPQDIGKALELYEAGAAGGFAGSLSNLIEAYLTGRWTPPNPARIDALLSAAEAAGYPEIAQTHAQIAGAGKMTNVQTIPPLGTGLPSSVAYSGFEGPELPPSVGFDAAFQKVYRAPFDDPAVAAQLKANLATLPTPYIYELARRTAPSDPREAQILFQLASLRMVYDGERCADRTALQGVAGWPRLMSQQIRFALRPVADKAALAAEVLAREAALPGNTVPVWICYHGISGVQAGLAGKTLEPLLVPAAQWPALRAAMRAATAENLASAK